MSHVPACVDDRLLAFLTSGHSQNANPGCHVDIARKRNIGMLLARLSGWRTIMFLDDDIRGMTAAAVSSAAAMTARFQAAGFMISDYPDNSVVCHAYRLIGRSQDVFPGASALVIDVAACDAPFPPIYNEDWLFLFDAAQRRSMTVAGALSQVEYQPFARPRRAASEEFGDVIAEGLYRLLHDGGSAADASAMFWRDILTRRSRLIDHIAHQLMRPGPDPRSAAGALMSLDAARTQLGGITELACFSFVRAWQVDVRAWRDRLAALPLLGDLASAAKYLDLPVSERCVM